MKTMKKMILVILALALTFGVVAAIGIVTSASNLPFVNLFMEGFAGYTSDEGQILAPDYVSSKEIAKAVVDQYGKEIDKKKIQMQDAIKSVGTHEVTVKLHPKVTATLKVKVVEGK